MVLLGYGESADAWHMSAPHPEGWAPSLDERRAAAQRLEPAQIDFTCAHGTATRSNDEIEAGAVGAVLGAAPCDLDQGDDRPHARGGRRAVRPDRGAGHRGGFRPGYRQHPGVDAACPVMVPLETRRQAVAGVLVNAFGFGGNNCSLVFGAAA